MALAEWELRAFYFVSSKYVDLKLLYVLGVHRKATNAAGTSRHSKGKLSCEALIYSPYLY